MSIAIIGAGICGLYLASKLSKRGFEVTVFEKNKEIGKTACSGLFSQRIFDFIPHLKEGTGFGIGGQDLTENQIEYTLLHFPKKTIRIDFSKKFFVMKHYLLDRSVASLAKNSGVKIVLNTKVDSIPKGFDKIIGCDGATSQVRKILKLKEPRFRLGILGFVFKKDFSHFVETWPTEHGFLWKIPRGN